MKGVRFYFGLFIFLVACADNKLHFIPNDLNENSAPENSDHTFFLIGDAGNYTQSDSAPVLDLLQKKLALGGSNSSVIFLGDNIYPGGMPSTDQEKQRLDAEIKIKRQLDILKDYPGNIYFVPGNHDYMVGKTKAIKRQEKFIEKYLDRGNTYLPDDGCGDPAVKEINENLVLLFINSEWFLADWAKDQTLHDGCEIRSRASFAFVLKELFNKYKDKQIICVMHHPLHSYGPHNGYYSLKQHLYPFNAYSKKFKIPMPVVGSLINVLRATVGSNQDMSSPIYKEYKNIVIQAASIAPNVIFASGHEHNLQYIKDGQEKSHHHIVSGAGSKTNPVNFTGHAVFTYGGLGFSELKIKNNKPALLRFWSPMHHDPIYQVNLYSKPSVLSTQKEQYYVPLKNSVDSVTKGLEIQETKKKSSFYKAIWGKHYRNAYDQKVKLPVLNLDSTLGGLQILELGGGHQTKSLRLKTKNGQEFVVRTFKKDPSFLLPPLLRKNKTAIQVLTDQFSASHPFGPIAVSALADAAEVYHTVPIMYFLPMQKSLANFNDLFGDQIVLLEERIAGDLSEFPQLGTASKITDTYKLLQDLDEGTEDRVDSKAFIRARLFDFLIGDWDRHEDQWRWGSRDNDKKNRNLHFPLPRDRDQAFSNYDGVIPFILRNQLPFFRQTTPFRDHIKDPKWMGYHARFLDKRLFNESTEMDFINVAKDLQNKLTDAKIQAAFSAWPSVLIQLDGLDLIKKLISRRNNLVKDAENYYKFLAQKIDIPGTHERDYFRIERLPNDRLLIKNYIESKKNKIEQYQRLVKGSETKQIFLYGMEKDDEFEIIGDYRSSIKINIIGGEDTDQIKNESSGQIKIIAYDQPNGIKLKGPSIKDLRSQDRHLNTYDPKSKDYEFPILTGLPILGFNPDDGFTLGFGFSANTFGFKKEPYKAKHKFGARLATATGGFNVFYKGRYTRLLKSLDGGLELKYQSPFYAINYFGLGATPIIQNAQNINFHRVSQSLARVEPAVIKKLGGESFISFNPFYESVEIEKRANRFINIPSSDLPATVFNRSHFIGLKSSLYFENLDQAVFPARGIKFELNYQYRNDLNNRNQNHRWTTALTAYMHLDKKQNLVYAGRLSMDKLKGPRLFYELPTLGADNYFRSFANQQIYSPNVFYYINDLRWKIGMIQNPIVPFTLGLSLTYDYAAVHSKSEFSTKYNAVGGATWINVLDMAVLHLGYYVSDQNKRFAFKIGFPF